MTGYLIYRHRNNAFRRAALAQLTQAQRDVMLGASVLNPALRMIHDGRTAGIAAQQAGSPP